MLFIFIILLYLGMYNTFFSTNEGIYFNYQNKYYQYYQNK